MPVIRMTLPLMADANVAETTASFVLAWKFGWDVMIVCRGDS
jgi:hypothetical protein